MSDEPKPKRAKKPAAEFTPEQARDAVLAKLRAAGAKGAGSFVASGAAPAKRAAIEQALAVLENEGAIAADRRKAKPKYIFAPTPDSVRARIDGLIEAKHPQLLSVANLTGSLLQPELEYLRSAVDGLAGERRLIRLRRGKTELLAHAASLRRELGDAFDAPESVAPISAGLPPVAVEVQPEAIREAYRTIASHTGLPAVRISALHRAVDLPLGDLQRWLVNEYQQGRAVLSFGDWSLADEATRAAAVEVGGERYLLVRLPP
ncbi:MAG: hypothetical protein QOE70_2155 [Chthoniobacter sp.]|jgi:hypothetical protein|nr:hypothetical protein [Chthoniobacter sp.]